MGKPALTKSSDENANWKLVAEYPFDSSIKRMSVLARAPDGSYYAFTKGATERVLSTCTGMYDGETMQVNELEEQVLPQVEELAKGGLRVLTLGMRQVGPRPA